MRHARNAFQPQSKPEYLVFRERRDGPGHARGFGGAYTGAVNFGAGDTALSPVIKDVGTVIALVLGAMFLWKRLK
ncbi:MAG: hypothetical protein HZT43_10795 [Exiguobacterium profundum]|nr:MAG: hypothetical protein HZT43_10795 [Exiguobacterium profundum]